MLTTMKSIFKKVITVVLMWEARRVLKKYKPKIVAITGSVGKTSTKDAIYMALSQSELTRKSEKSFNSDIGVPLTILGLPNAWDNILGWIENLGEGFLLPWRNEEYPKWLVLEIGVDRPGDIARFSWLKPNIVVFTQFPKVPVHVEFFSSPEQVANEKRLLKEYLVHDGTLIINGDDVRMGREEVKEGQHKLVYGHGENATVRGYEYKIEYEDGLPTGISFKAQFQDKIETVWLPGVVGQHHMYPALAALTVIVSEGKAFGEVAQVFKEQNFAPGRMRLLKGINGSVIIDDSYNSSPIAVQAGIDAMGAIQSAGKRIVVLGDMLELGEFSVREHREVGALVASSADMFISVGVRMLAAAESALSANARCKKIESFQTGVEAIDLLQSIISEGDVVFVKGSQGMRLERVVENILHNPQTAVKVLARQDPHWKSRP